MTAGMFHSNTATELQLDEQGRLRHFLTIDGLSRELLWQIIELADKFSGVSERDVKKVPLLRGKVVVNLFFETSTRTRTTFELAAKRLSADVLNINIAAAASANKGETLLDTIRNLEAMYVDMFVVRHGESGAAHFIAQHVAPHISVINAGDGRHAHPTQAMLDMFTIWKLKGDFTHLRVAIVGDVLHSRVARSVISALRTLGCPDVRIIAPKTLMPTYAAQAFGVGVYYDLAAGLAGVDVIIVLRLQRERMSGAFLPSEGEYYRCFGLRPDTLKYAKPDAIVMHPGPINRGVEIDSRVADGPQAVILQQVSYGIAVRMAVLSMAMQRTPAGTA